MQKVGIVLFKVLLFGTGSGCTRIKNILKENVNIIGYIDNDQNKVGIYYDNNKIYSVSEAITLTYDYIIITSIKCEQINNQLLDMGVKNEKIIKFWDYAYYDEFKNKYFNFIKSDTYDGIVTGISYADSGINIDFFQNKKIFNFAIPSQDLFYDYKIVEKILNDGYLKSSKYAIICLAYYSFEYDLSLSDISNNIPRYYEILQSVHNYKGNVKSIMNEYNIFKKNTKQLLRENYKDILETLNYFSEDNGEIAAYNDSNKNYINTRKENIFIFNKYLSLLSNNNIKPIVVVLPTSKCYSKHFSEKLKKDFLQIIHDVNEKFDFQYIDYFDSKLFSNEDFKDPSHLNINGAQKFTSILNEDIIW